MLSRLGSIQLQALAKPLSQAAVCNFTGEYLNRINAFVVKTLQNPQHIRATFAEIHPTNIPILLKRPGKEFHPMAAKFLMETQQVRQRADTTNMLNHFTQEQAARAAQVRQMQDNLQRAGPEIEQMQGTLREISAIQENQRRALAANADDLERVKPKVKQEAQATYVLNERVDAISKDVEKQKGYLQKISEFVSEHYVFVSAVALIAAVTGGVLYCNSGSSSKGAKA